MQDFEKAATPTIVPEQQLVITSDVDRTLIDFGRINYDLLEFLNDSKRAGHRVIITSTLSAVKIADSVDLINDFSRMRGLDVLDSKEFELISKNNLPSDLEIDYAFDDEPITYANPAFEIRVNKDFSTTPLSLDALRSLCKLPKKENSQESADVGVDSPAP